MGEKIIQHPTYESDFNGENSYARLIIMAEDKKETTSVYFRVQYRHPHRGWEIPAGWYGNFLSKISAPFAWGTCPTGAYIQVARWLEMQLYIDGALHPDLQLMLGEMTEQDFLDTFEKCFKGPLVRSAARPYYIDDLESRILKNRINV